MPNYKIFLTNGCSVTHGTELSDCPISNDSRIKGIPSKFAWPQLVGNELKLDVINIATPASSNERIERTTIHKVLELLKQYNSDEILVGLKFSHLNRAEYPIKRYDNSMFWELIGLWTFDDKEQHFKNDFIDRLIIDNYFMVYKLLSAIFNLQQFLKNNNISYFMSSVKHDIIQDISTEDDFSYLINAINWDDFFFIDNNNMKYCSFNNFGGIIGGTEGPEGHYIDDVHKAYADIMIPWIKDRFFNKNT